MPLTADTREEQTRLKCWRTKDMKWCVCRGRVQFYLYVLNPLWTTNILVARNRSKAKRPGSLRVENRPGNAMRPPFFGPSLTITRSFTIWYKTWWPDGLFALLVCAIPNKEESRSGRYLFVLLFFDAIPHPSLGVCVCEPHRSRGLDRGSCTLPTARNLFIAEENSLLIETYEMC